jgi:hypothetical protein
MREDECRPIDHGLAGAVIIKFINACLAMIGIFGMVVQ